MVVSPRLLATVLLVLCTAGLGGCGAGLITGISASGNGGSQPEARVPELSVALILPLVPAANSVRSVLVTNAQLAGAATLEVRLEALGVTVVQRNPLASGLGGSTSIAFGLDTKQIVAAVSDPTLADVPANLSVWADGRRIANPVPITLARQPTASLVVPMGEQQLFLPPGGRSVTIEVEGLRSTKREDVQVLVTTNDPTGAIMPTGETPKVTRLATGIEIEIEPSNGGPPRVSAFIPGNTFPVATEIVVRDFIAGESTQITNAYYEPALAVALPSQGPTTGGTLLTLIGSALVPHDFTTGASPAPFDFDAVKLSFLKPAVNGRKTVLRREDFRAAESASDRLVFTMPPSPDGRPGQVEILLEVDLGNGVVGTASQVYLFANPDPFFGPRGAVLDELPVAIAMIQLDNAPQTSDAPDVAVLTDQGGVAFLQLLLAQQNGMFQPFAAPRQIGNHEVAAERGPRDLCVADFDGDGVPDLFIVNEGAATAVHHLVLGQQRPNPPLGAVFRVAAAPGSWRARGADFDGDQRQDILLVPGPNAPMMQRPQVLLSRPLGIGQPSFTMPIDLPVRDFAYDAVEVADLNGDMWLDVAVVSGEELKLDVAYGNGDGTFAPSEQFNLTVPGYTPNPASPAVGLHACRDAVRQSLGLVLAGLSEPPTPPPMTPPLIAVLKQVETAIGSGVFQFVSPEAGVGSATAGGIFPTPTDPIGRSLAANLDAQGPIELVVGMKDDPQVISLGLLQLQGSAFAPVQPAIELGVLTNTEAALQIRSLAFDTAFPAAAPSGERKAVFIVHEVIIDGVRERRLSTRLVSVPDPPQPQQPILLPPDAGGSLSFSILNVVGGNFHATTPGVVGSALDLALVRIVDTGMIEEVVLIENDGVGGVPSISSVLAHPGLLPDSLTLLPSPIDSIDRLVFCNRDSRLGFWLHVPPTSPGPPTPPPQTPTALTLPLRDLLQAPLATISLDDETRMQVADVDGDGVPDLVVLMSFSLPAPTEGDGRIALLLGKPAPLPGEFPFWMPTTLTPVHGNASSFALGDLAMGSGPGPRWLEMAVPIPTGTNSAALDGNHVRFFRYVAGADPTEAHFEPSAIPGGPQVLLAGNEPNLVVASDFDRDGLVDLLVSCRGDNTLRLFRNTATPGGPAGQVDVNAFVEGLASPFALAIGKPTLLKLSDVNGDGNLDAVVFVEASSGPGMSTSVAVYLSSGSGEFDGPRFASPTRIGNRDAVLAGDLGDWNRDGVPDLFLGWSTQTPVNLRVLFGGTR